jgi:hypothetical protein
VAEIKIKTREELQGFLDKRFGEVEERIGAAVTREEFNKGLAEVKLLLGDAGRTPIATGDGKARTLGITKEQYLRVGARALYMAPRKDIKTPSYKDGAGFFDDVDFENPAQALHRAGDLAMAECALRQIVPSPENFRSTRAYREVYRPAYARAMEHVKEAFDISTAGEGLEWIPDEYSPEMVARVRLGWRVIVMFPKRTLTRSPLVVPVFRDDVKAYRVFPSPTSESASNITEGLGTANVTANMTFQGERLAVPLFWSWDVEEDVVVALAAELLEAQRSAISNGIEAAAISGDTDGTHQDSDIGASTTDATTSWDGFRKIGLSNSGNAKQDAGNARIDDDAIWASKVRGAIGGMGRYGVNGDDLVLIMGTQVSNQLREIPRFATLEVFGQLATNMNPNLNSGSFGPDGMHLVVSEFARENLNASGVYDGVTTDRATISIVHRRAWELADGGSIKNKPVDQVYALKGLTGILATWRGDFQRRYGFEAIHTGIVYNIATP